MIPVPTLAGATGGCRGASPRFGAQQHGERTAAASMTSAVPGSKRTRRPSPGTDQIVDVRHVLRSGHRASSRPATVRATSAFDPSADRCRDPHHQVLGAQPLITSSSACRRRRRQQRQQQEHQSGRAAAAASPTRTTSACAGPNWQLDHHVGVGGRGAHDWVVQTGAGETHLGIEVAVSPSAIPDTSWPDASKRWASARPSAPVTSVTKIRIPGPTSPPLRRGIGRSWQNFRLSTAGRRISRGRRVRQKPPHPRAGDVGVDRHRRGIRILDEAQGALARRRQHRQGTPSGFAVPAEQNPGSTVPVPPRHQRGVVRGPPRAGRPTGTRWAAVALYKSCAWSGSRRWR